MAQSYLIFDFGANEEAAQRARHRIEGWKQGFRLGGKMQIKFERAAAEGSAETRIRVLVRLDFSDHEKLSHQRWLERMPTEELFKDAAPRIVRAGDKDHAATAELFRTLD